MRLHTMSFRIIRNDITKVSADAIVNTANPNPEIGGGTDSAIYKAAGKERLLAERKRIGMLTPGQVKETPAFDLDANYIFHAIGPVWQDGKNGEEEILKNTYLNSLKLAEKLKCKSIAFPLMCSGVNGFPDGKALNIALSTLQGYALESNLRIILVLFSTTVTELCGNVYDSIQQFVDDNYVEKIQKEEYFCYDRDFLKEERLREYRLFRHNNITDNLESSSKVAPENNISSHSRLKEDLEPVSDIAELLKAKDEKTFVEKIIEYVDRSGKKDSEIYKPMEYSKQAYSKMMSNLSTKPKKNTAMLFCLSLELTYEESIDLLARAGYTFDVTEKKELVVEACIKNGFYDIWKINFMLEDNGLPMLIKY